MIGKVIKYDWKLNANRYVSIAAILIVAELLLLLSAIFSGWDKFLLYALSVTGFVAALIAVSVTVCQTYARNLSAYGRMLLPVHPLATILSPIVIGAAGVALLAAASYGHQVLYGAATGINLSGLGFRVSINTASAISGILMTTTMMLLLVVNIFFSITIFKTSPWRKLAPWMGILSFFLINWLVSAIENLLFPNRNDAGWIEPKGSESDWFIQIQLADGKFFATAAFEVVVIAILVYAMTRLIRSRRHI
ncbi:hypothetical protein [Paenibacillus sp. NPDC058071]|uniref:hypothetical protein n=1 Tax=Paenibacillus sp. NPDC058071 TaxID=3346326 RepID=UPI0036DE7CB8